MNTPITVPGLICPDMLPLRCIVNCEERVATHGGTLVTGWKVELFGELMQLSHHCVWESPAGELFDVTPAVLGQVGDNIEIMYSTDPIQFVIDPDAKFVGEKPFRKCLPNRYESANPRLNQACGWLTLADRHYYGGDRQAGNYYNSKANRILHKHGCHFDAPPEWAISGMGLA